MIRCLPTGSEAVQLSKYLITVTLSYHTQAAAYMPTFETKKRNYGQWRTGGPTTVGAQKKGQWIIIQLAGLAEHYKLPSDVWGKAPADFNSGAFWASQASGENDYGKFRLKIFSHQLHFHYHCAYGTDLTYYVGLKWYAASYPILSINHLPSIPTQNFGCQQ